MSGDLVGNASAGSAATRDMELLIWVDVALVIDLSKPMLTPWVVFDQRSALYACEVNYENT